MESQQFTGEDGRNYMSSSSDEALPDTIVSGKVQHGHYDISPRPRRRAILKDGYSNTFNSNVPLAGLTSVTQDFFTFMMECRWRTLLLLFFTSFLFSWLVFAALYWAVAFGHGDLRGYDELHDPTKEPCVTMMDDFISCFLFSMETQYSSGYGTRSPTTECPEAVFLVGFQSIFGALLQLSMSGIIFAKFARPKMRQQAIMFSEKAVISVRDRHLCLMFRLGDCRKSRLLGATVSARLLQHRVSAEGEKLPLYQHTLKLSVDSSGSNIFLLWPLTAVHRIDSSSPLYDISAADLAASTFEVFVALAGTVETMGQDTEARTSYTAQEILWGHRLTPLVKTCGRGYILDYSRFHSTVPVDTPRCSARQLYCWTHNYVRLNKDPGILGNPHGFLDDNKRFLREKDDFLGNNDEFFGNKDEFLEKKRLLDSKDGVSGNGEGFSDNKQSYLVDKGGFLCNGDEFLEERDQVLGEKNGYIISDQGNELSKKKDGILCPIFWGNGGKSLTNNRSPNSQGGILDIGDEISGSIHPLLGDEESHSANNDLFVDKHEKVLTKKVSGATTNVLSTGRVEFLNRKYDYSGTKDIFSDKSELVLNRREGLLDKKFEFLGNKDRILGKSDDEVVGKTQPADYREENELEQNSANNLSGPVRKISTILKDGHESNLHHSLISLLDKKQRNRLTTLSEDDLR